MVAPWEALPEVWECLPRSSKMSRGEPLGGGAGGPGAPTT
jgi:hypothetical protein